MVTYTKDLIGGNCLVKRVTAISMLDSLPDDQVHWLGYSLDERGLMLKVPHSRVQSLVVHHEIDLEFKLFVHLLRQYGVAHLVVGGYAVVLHGFTRDISDLDIWVEASKRNITRLLKVLRSYGVDESIVKKAQIQRNTVLQIGLPPYRIDILFGLRDLHFRSCVNRAVLFPCSDITLEVIGKKDLIKSKELAGREKDNVDSQCLKSLYEL